MSRRKLKAWEDLVTSQQFLADNDEELWRGVAAEVGLSVEDFESPGRDYEYTGNMELDVTELKEAAENLFFSRRGGGLRPLAMVTLKCQRCGRRLDALRLRSSGWVHPQYGSGDGWKLGDLRVSSELRGKIVGEANFAELAKPTPVEYECPCGRSNIQLSTRRLLATMQDLLPAQPRWSPGGDDAYIIWPATRHLTIRG